MTTRKIDQLRKLEQSVDGDVAEKGKALSAIAHKRLYLVTHKTFETYCREVWGMTRSHAYRMMYAWWVWENLANAVEENGWPQPGVSHCEQLAIFDDPQDQIEVWRLVVESAPHSKSGGRGISAKHVRSVVDIVWAAKKKRLGEVVNE